MKGKLVKNNHFYALQIDSNVIAVSLDKETEEHTVNYKHQLSLKNCQAIELGYDLDEMSKEETRKFLGHDVPENIMLFIAHSKMFQVGFQKALEILGDKKFSKKQLKYNMLELFFLTRDKHEEEAIFKERQLEFIDKRIESLQQTEWEVEVVMDGIPADLAPDGWDVFPKLDEQNCLILKRVE